MTKDLPPSNPCPPDDSGDSHHGADGGFFIEKMDLFAWSEQQQKRNPSAAKSLPMAMIREALELDPTSPSHLRWKTRPRRHFDRDRDWERWNRLYAGNSAGSVIADGRGRKYWQLKIGNAKYKAHRIVYALAFGIDPGTLHIDHIDGDSQNNSPDNLRLATNSENLRNRGANRNNTSGRKGVCWYRRHQKWMASIKLHGHKRHLGYFDSPDEAAAAYARAAEALHGDFARTA